MQPEFFLSRCEETKCGGVHGIKLDCDIEVRQCCGCIPISDFANSSQVEEISVFQTSACCLSVGLERQLVLAKGGL